MLYDNDGFVLMEVVVAVFMIAILFLPIASIMVSAAKTSERGNEIMDASLLGQKYMELLKGDASNIIEGQYSAVEGSYDVSVTVVPYFCNSDGSKILLWRALIIVEWDEDSITFENLIWNRR